MTPFVFHDPTGRRGRQANLALGLAIALVLAIFAAFAATLALAPSIPNVNFRDPHVLTGLRMSNAQVRHKRIIRPILPKPAAVRGHGTRPLTVAFYVSWDEQARQSLKEHLGQIDIVSPQWVELTSARGDLGLTDDPNAEQIMLSAARPPSVLP